MYEFTPTGDTIKMPSGYSSREDPGQMKKNKQSMADLKLRRLTELNARLREDLDRERIPVSQAAKSIISYTNSTKDFMVLLSGNLALHKLTITGTISLGRS